MKWSYFMLEIMFLQDLNLNILEIFFSYIKNTKFQKTKGKRSM